MALGHYQQSAEAVSGTTLLGGYVMVVAGSTDTAVNAATSGLFKLDTIYGSASTILGIGNLTGFTENLEFTTTQAGNSDEPDKAVAGHTLTITFDLLEFYLPNWDIIRGSQLDLAVYASVSTYLAGAGSAGTGSAGTVNTISTGGLTAIGWKAYAFYNQKLVAGITAETVIIIHKAKIETGITLTPKSDHDTDPVLVTPITLTAELDTSRDFGDQLFVIETELGTDV